MNKGTEEAKALQKLARHQTISRLLADILFDLNVCRIEGWDHREFLRELQDLIGELGEKYEKTIGR